MILYEVDDPRVSLLQNGVRTWWDVSQDRLVRALTLYLPQGCPDWGEKMSPPHNLCTFCALPAAARGYREAFFDGRYPTATEYLGLFAANLKHLAPESAGVHTLMVFNAGSFLSAANPIEVQIGIARMVAEHPTLRRLVIESRAELITPFTLGYLTEVLRPANKKLTIRIGVETQNDELRMKKLRKGHTRSQLAAAAEIMKKEGVTSGAYVLLNPAPGLDPEWAIHEACQTIDWILGPWNGELGMEEAYFGATCVAPGTPLADEWSAGRFQPASLWATWRVALYGVRRYGPRVHLLPFKDEPAFLAVPSNHSIQGIPESLEGATGCDIEFHEMLQGYRETMNPMRLEYPPKCSCRPSGTV
jgi:radical SAM enzyme (TIGR01210 family)